MVTNNSANNATGASGTVLQGQGVGTASAFSTATYPSTATSAGKILRADGTNWAATTATYPNTAGSSGNVLTSDGTNWNSTAPAAGVGSQLVLIQSQTASNSASISFTTGIASPYTKYLFVIDNLVATNAGNFLGMQVSVNGGSSYLSTGYTGNVWFFQNGSTTISANATTTNLATCHIDTAIPTGGYIWCFGIVTAAKPTFHGQMFETTTSNLANYNSINSTTSGVNAFTFFMTGNNISTGKFTLYAFKET